MLSTWLDIRYRTHCLNLLKLLISKQELQESMKFEKPLLSNTKKSDRLSQAQQSDKVVQNLMISANRYLDNRFYYDEVSLMTFTEHFLDFFIEESYKKVLRKREQTSTKMKIAVEAALWCAIQITRIVAST